MRTLKYALLGAISRGPKSGYDLMQEFNEDMAHSWYAAHSQIYPELRRLTNEGLVEYNVTIQGQSLQKKVYMITEKGREEFQHWMTKELDLVSVPKDEFRLKMYYFDCIPPEAALAQVKSQKEKRMERISKIKHALSHYPSCPTEPEKIADYLALTGSAMREASYIEWLDLCAEKIQELADRS